MQRYDRSSSDRPSLRVAVVGCGGIGGTLAACLTRAGVDTTAVTGNPAIAAAIERHGYHVRDFGGPSWSVAPNRPPVVALDDGASPGPFDLCILATQNPALESALAAALPHLAARAPVLVCQNGLPEERAARVAGEDRVLGAVVGWGASMVEPGRYHRTSGGAITVGRPMPGSPDPAAWVPLLEAASEVRVAADLQAVRWSKLAINCVTTTLGAVSGRRLGALLRHRFARRLGLEVFAEVAAVARASGVRPVPLAGTLDIEKVAITPAERSQRFGSPSLGRKHAILLAVGFKYRRLRSSMLYAIEKGRPPEIDALQGEIVRRGAALDIPTPVSAALVEAVDRLVDERGRAGGARPSLDLLRDVYDRAVAPRAATALAA